MIDAYLDESGIHEQAKVCVIAGYFGGVSQMKKLERAWRKVLADFDFPMKDFHAKDLVSARKHRPMLDALAVVISKQRKIFPASHGIVVDDFRQFSTDERRFLTGAALCPQSGELISSGCPSKPYFVPFQEIIKIATDYAPVGGKARFRFGTDRPFAEYAKALFRKIRALPPSNEGRPWSSWKTKDRLGDPTFPLASETPQLQAADLLAHLTYLHMQEWIAKGSGAAPSPLLRTCLANKRCHADHQYQDKECLQHTLDGIRSFIPRWNPRPVTAPHPNTSSQ